MAIDTSLPGDVTVQTIDTPGLGNRSYLLAADGWAVAVDVPRDIDRVAAELDRAGLKLAAVLETHLHNDYVTGGLALARASGARYLVPQGPPLSFDATRVGDGDQLALGPVTVRAINAPGHTDAHVAYAFQLTGEPALGAFTGGSLLLGGTGRTDLLGPARARALAKAQYWTVRRLARLLPGTARILPTHGFGSHCRAGTGPVVAGGPTLADQLEVTSAFLLDEAAFVEEITREPGPIPRYFPMMAPRNAAGPSAADVAAPPPLTTADLLAAAAGGATIVDVRPREQFAAGHVPDSLGIDAAGAVGTWTGWFVPVDDPVVLVGSDLGQLATVRRELSRIGFDRVLGAHVGAPAGPPLRTLRRVSFADVAGTLGAGQVAVLDVREDAEWRTGHVLGALHVPAHALPDTPAAPGDAWVYCAAGFRATVAASLLARRGGSPVVVDDDVAIAAAAGVPWCPGQACPDDRCLGAAAAAAEPAVAEPVAVPVALPVRGADEPGHLPGHAPRIAHRVVIAGAGASGTLVAADLLRLRAGDPHLTVTLVDPGAGTGRGVAYSTVDDRHLLNVRAANMSADPADPDQFLRWARRHRDPDARASDFLPRRWYGDYLEHVLRAAAADARGTLHRVRAQVTDVTPTLLGYRVELGTGAVYQADQLVLALGGAPGQTRWAPAELRASPRFYPDPWQPGVLADLRARHQRILLVGAGLTMVDVALSVAGPGRTLIAYSRSGTLPTAHGRPGAGAMATPALADHALTLADLERFVAGQLRRSREQFGTGGPGSTRCARSRTRCGNGCCPRSRPGSSPPRRGAGRPTGTGWPRRSTAPCATCSPGAG